MTTKLKTTKETSKTFTMTFEFNDIDELKELKALSILLGNFNPMRKEMTNGNTILDILQEEKENSVLSNIVLKISNQLK